MTVEELEYRMPATEYRAWQIYNSYEPLNTSEVQLATISALLAASKGKAEKLSSFMVSTSKEERKEKTKQLTGSQLNDRIKGMF